MSAHGLAISGSRLPAKPIASTVVSPRVLPTERGSYLGSSGRSVEFARSWLASWLRTRAGRTMRPCSTDMRRIRFEGEGTQEGNNFPRKPVCPVTAASAKGSPMMAPSLRFAPESCASLTERNPLLRFVTGLCVADLAAVATEVKPTPAGARTRACFGHEDLPDRVRAHARCWPAVNGEERRRW
jgi:hypothetical protein